MQNPFKKIVEAILQKKSKNQTTSEEDFIGEPQSRQRYGHWMVNKILTYFEKKKPYLNSDLKLADLAKEVGINKTYISQSMNHAFGKNFNQFCNYYRLRYACRLYIEKPTLSLDALRKRSGFNSQAAFFNAFNIYLRKSPSKWCLEAKTLLSANKEVSVDAYLPPLKKKEEPAAQ